MSADEKDPIADTGMFRAFVAKGETEATERRTPTAPAVLAVVGVLVIVCVLIWLLVR